MEPQTTKHKHWKKILVIVFSILLFLLLAPVAYFATCSWLFPGNADDEKIAYIQKHYWRLDNNCAIKENSLFSEVTQPTVFILGEVHGFSRTQIFDAELLKYLNQKFGVRDYFNEDFTEDAQLLNEFLTTTPMDLKLLKQTMKNLKGDIPQRYNQEYIDKWVNIYKYNQTLPKDKKIIVYGLLGDKANYKGRRDSTMIANYKRLSTGLRDSVSIYCSTGQGHIFQANYNGIQPFGAWLKANHHKVISIAHIPIDSYGYLPKGLGIPAPGNEMTDWMSVNGPIMYFHNIVNVDKAFDSPTLALCKLDAKGSPYTQGVDLIKQQSPLSFLIGSITPEKGKSTIDYFQYIFVTKGLKGPKLLR